MPGRLARSGDAAPSRKLRRVHTKNGSNKISWLHGLVAADPLADSKACLSCHKMPATAFNPHGASAEALKQSTRRLTKIAAGLTAPRSAIAQSVAFPMKDVIAGDLYCATCHQEHQGINFNLNKISNEQCRSCHIVKFGCTFSTVITRTSRTFRSSGRRTRLYLRSRQPFRQALPGIGEEGSGKECSGNLLNLSQQQQ